MKKLIRYLNSMSAEAYLILKAGVILSCIILMAALFLLIWHESTQEISVYELLHILRELRTLPQAVLIPAVILSACAENIFN